MAGKIRILPERVANQIAAGEVVERPASVAKELLENALDAGARRIEVEVRQAGRLLIRVEDDGSGMSPEDAELAFRRHATSKLAEAEDLARLSSYGFRGEALPSIASVSHCTLRTRQAGSDAGTEVLVDGGRLVHVRACGCPPGTRVEVARLFDPVPARRKFLKSDRTEAGHLSHCVRLYALACPGVAFTLIEDGRVAFRSPACPSLKERVGELYGPQFAADLAALSASEGGYRLRGLLGRPGTGRPSRHDTLVFVNGRPVDSRTLVYGLLEGYREWLPQGRFPPAVLFFDCDPAAVDVNVHPAKREVRFRQEASVRAFVIAAVRTWLEEAARQGAGAAPVLVSAHEPPDARDEARGVGEKTRWALAPHEPPPRAVPASEGGRAVHEETAARASSAPAPSWRYLGTFQGNLAVFEAASGLVLLDRRAALERIWFDRLLAENGAGEAPSQRLLLVQPLELDPIAEALLLDHRRALGRHGFEFADFGRGFFRIEAIPAWLEPAEAEGFLRTLLGEIREGTKGPGGDPDGLLRDRLARLAAARAARLGSAPAEAEIRALVAQLFGTRSPLVSPSGRPTCVELTQGELGRRFDK